MPYYLGNVRVSDYDCCRALAKELRLRCVKLDGGVCAVDVDGGYALYEADSWEQLRLRMQNGLLDRIYRKSRVKRTHRELKKLITTPSDRMRR